MMKERFLRIMLMLIALLLFSNLLKGHVTLSVSPEASASSAQKLTFRGNGVGIACSSDGRYVYAVGSGRILRSRDYGAAGSWEVLVED